MPIERAEPPEPVLPEQAVIAEIKWATETPAPQASVEPPKYAGAPHPLEDSLIFASSGNKERPDLKILDEQNLVKFDGYLREAIEKTFEDVKPVIIENIKNRLPDIIERLVKEEIEKIKSRQDI